MPINQDYIYNMNHSRRGIAVIFNYEKFDEHLGLSVRNGTDVDQDSS